MDYKKFYEDQKDYSAFRDDDEKRNDYELIVRWKADQLQKLVPQGISFNNILEIGCALGILLNDLAGRLSINNRYGIDISGNNISMAKKLYPESHFYQGTIEDYLAGNPDMKKFDVVLLSDIIEHVEDDLKFLESVRAITSYAIINLPLEKCFRNRNRVYGENDPSGHLRWYDRQMGETLIEKAGFVIVNSFTMNSLQDRNVFSIHLKERKGRLMKKPLLKKVFWQVYYSAEDMIRILNSRLYEKIHGTNLFTLVKSR
jgi:SAM-dependent methyltransferase